MLTLIGLFAVGLILVAAATGYYTLRVKKVATPAQLWQVIPALGGTIALVLVVVGWSLLTNALRARDACNNRVEGRDAVRLYAHTLHERLRLRGLNEDADALDVTLDETLAALDPAACHL